MGTKEALLGQAALMDIPHLFGLIGYPVSHSFSKRYFSEKFEREGLSGHGYTLFPLEDISWFPELLEAYPHLRGLNVTIPYKEQVMPYLDALDESASGVGAVNVIRIEKGKTIGFNSDVFGFERALEQFLGAARSEVNQALVLGTGGASKSVAYVLRKWGIPFITVSRSAQKADMTYEGVGPEILAASPLIIQTTPLGMSPKTDTLPYLPYDHLSDKHFLFDLVYNPEHTAFMEQGRARGARICNGLEMLYAQAEKAWEYWQ